MFSNTSYRITRKVRCNLTYIEHFFIHKYIYIFLKYVVLEIYFEDYIHTAEDYDFEDYTHTPEDYYGKLLLWSKHIFHASKTIFIFRLERFIRKFICDFNASKNVHNLYKMQPCQRIKVVKILISLFVGHRNKCSYFKHSFISIMFIVIIVSSNKYQLNWIYFFRLFNTF